jgi:cell division septum initiation protein DivIVA
VLDSLILDNEQYRKEVRVLLELVERRIHRAIELDQLILLEAEVLQEDLKEVGNIKANETLQSIEARTEEHASILYEIKRKLREVLLNELEE